MASDRPSTCSWSCSRSSPRCSSPRWRWAAAACRCCWSRRLCWSAAGLAVFLLGLRHNERAGPAGHRLCDHGAPAAGRQHPGPVRHAPAGEPARPARGRHEGPRPAVPVTRWPVVGQTLPIEAAPNNPRQVRVRWDLVELGYIRAPDATPPRPIDPRTDPTPIARQQTFVDPATADPPMATVHVYSRLCRAGLSTTTTPRAARGSPAGPASGARVHRPTGRAAADPPLDPDYDDSLDGPTVANPGAPRRPRAAIGYALGHRRSRPFGPTPMRRLRVDRTRRLPMRPFGTTRDPRQRRRAAHRGSSPSAARTACGASAITPPRG